MRALVERALHRRGGGLAFTAFERVDYLTFTTPGGCQVPSPGGRIEGGVSFGQ